MTKNANHNHDHNEKKHHDHHNHSSHSKNEAHQNKHEEHKDHDHHDHHKMMIKDFKLRLIISAILTIPVLLLSPMIKDLLGFEWSFTGELIVLFGLASLIYFYGAFPFLKGMVKELKEKSPGMMTLIAVAVTAAYLYSSAVVFGLQGKTFFWELATLVDVMLLGHWLEMRSILGANKALQALAELMPKKAHRIKEDGSTEEVNADDLNNGDIILIKPGEKIPADGIVTEGTTHVNESMLTGESEPVKKELDSTIIGGSVNGHDSIKMEVQKTGQETYLSKIIEMVKKAQGQKSKTQKLADKAAFWLTIIALGSGLACFAVWMLLGKELSFALERMVTLMVICCPHALGLAIPLVASISTSLSAKNGLLIQNRTAFENSRKISTIVFDKTGTLTKGSHKVTRLKSIKDSISDDQLLQIAASAEQSSEHHISGALIKELEKEELSLLETSDFKYESGVGVRAKVDGNEIAVGGYLMLEKSNIKAPEIETEAVETVIFVIQNGDLIGHISLSDEIRESSQSAVNSLKESGIKVSLLTGDNQKLASAVAETLGIDNFKAEVLPEDKLSEIKKMQEQGEFVAMTGDGVNDAPALSQADVGIAIGSGTDVAAETADIILVDSDPLDVVKLIDFGKATYRKMKQNLVWATAYNVIALPLATGFIPGLMISPAMGAALMSLSTIICAVNAQLLRWSL